MFTSLEDPSFQIQQRFTAINDSSTCTQASVSTGLAMEDTGATTIQLSTPRNGQSSLNTINSCPINFYVNGIIMTLPGPESILVFDENGTNLGDDWGDWGPEQPIVIIHHSSWDGIIYLWIQERTGVIFAVNVETMYVLR